MEGGGKNVQPKKGNPDGCKAEIGLKGGGRRIRPRSHERTWETCRKESMMGASPKGERKGEKMPGVIGS